MRFDCCTRTHALGEYTNRYVGIFVHIHSSTHHVFAGQNASLGARRHRTSVLRVRNVLGKRGRTRCPSCRRRSQQAGPHRWARVRACVNAPPGQQSVEHRRRSSSVCLLGWPMRNSCDCCKNVVTQTWRHMHIRCLVSGNLLVFAIARSG